MKYAVVIVLLFFTLTLHDSDFSEDGMGVFRWNVYEDRLERSPANARHRYNPMQDEWQPAPDHYKNKWNHIKDRHRYVHSDAELDFNPKQQEWQYRRPGGKNRYNPWTDRWEYER